MLRAEDYDLCLVDIRTPVLNGIELYQWLQDKHSQLATRVIFTTGAVISEPTTAFIEQTGRPFLPKPFTPDELKAVVRETLKQLER